MTLAIIIVFQIFSVSTTLFRLASRYANNKRNAHNGLWYDDVFAALAACGGVYVLCVLVVIGTLVASSYRPGHMHRLTECTACRAPVLHLLEYRLALSGYFFTVWYALSFIPLDFLLRSGVGRLEPA